MREVLVETINRALPAREAAMLVAMVWGETGGLGWEGYQSLVASGLIHIVVVSGTNVMLVMRGIVENLAEVWGRKRMIVVGLGLMWMYVGIVGWQIPVVRAALLVSLVYLAQWWGRKFDVLRAIVVVVGIVVIGNWRIVTEASFWLTMTAFGGVVTSRKFIVFNFKFINIAAETVWISLWVTPILAMNFGKISLVAPITNAMVLGLVGTITILGMIGSVLNQGWVLWLTVPLLRWVEMVVDWGSRWGGVVEVKFNWLMLMGWYLVLGYWLLKRR